MWREPVSATSVERQEITTLEDLQAIVPAWGELWAGCPSSTPFQSPEWLLPWWHHCGGTGLNALAFFADSRLVGLFPLFRYHDPERGRSRLELLGTGVSDHGDVLVLPEYAAAVVAAFREYLSDRVTDDEECRFQQLAPDSWLLQESDYGWEARTEGQDPCPVLTAKPTLTEAIPRPLRKSLEYDRRRLERSFAVRFEQVRGSQITVGLEGLYRLHGARWEERGRSGVLKDAALQLFHHEVARGFETLGILRLVTLWLDDQAAAVFYGFTWRARTFYYLGGFDPEFSRYGVGNQIIWQAISGAEQDGAHVFDFLRGQEPYKYRWGAVDQPSTQLRLLSPRFARCHAGFPSTSS